MIKCNLEVLVTARAEELRTKKLQTICLSEWEIEWQRVAVVKFAMNKIGSYGTRCGTHSYADDNQIFGLCKPNDSAELQYCCVYQVASVMLRLGCDSTGCS